VDETEHGADGPLSEDARELMRTLRETFLALRAGRPPDWIAAATRGGRVSPRHLPVLFEVALDGPHSVTTLAVRLGVSLPAASLMVAELDEAGLVTRSPDPGDRRRTLVSLGPGTAESARRWVRERAAVFQGVVDALGPDERRGLLRGLTLIREGLGDGDAACR